MGRRLVLAEPRRLAAGALAVGLALMLVLLFQGLWTGVRAQVTVYEDKTGADLFVLAPDAASLFAEGSTLPLSTVDTVRAVPGTAWAAPVRSGFSILDMHGKKVAVTLVGSQPGQPGGPWAIAQGHAATADDEAVIDPSLAAAHHLGIGDTLPVQSRTLRVVGITTGPGSFMIGLVFVRHDAAGALLATPDTTSFVLVGTPDPAGVRTRLTSAGLQVVDKAQLRDADLTLATRIYGQPLRLMVASAITAGILIVGLVTYTGVVERRRQYGLLKALGAGKAAMVRLAFGHALALGLLGTVAGSGLVYGVRALLALWRPQFPVILTPAAFGYAAAAGLAMAVVAGLLPAARLARLDPATAFRSA
ncbi:MAG TPA: ABC transporter permease [Micromonosporaceae bacterium]